GDGPAPPPRCGAEPVARVAARQTQGQRPYRIVYKTGTAALAMSPTDIATSRHRDIVEPRSSLTPAGRDRGRLGPLRDTDLLADNRKRKAGVFGPRRIPR